MRIRPYIDRLHVLAAMIAVISTGAANAVEMTNLDGLEDIFGNYAPGGDCSREPLITVDRDGLTFEVQGKAIKVTNPEYAASYGPADYAGISKWIFPFRMIGGYPILMTFNANESRDLLLIEPHDEGWAGGPPLSPLNKALVGGSPYARCR